MITAIIPVRNETELTEPLTHLLDSARGEDFEVIICNDGSVYPCGQFHPLKIDHPQVKVINTPVSRGVGYSFDRGAEAATGDIIVITACDVYPKQGWYDKIKDAVLSHPDSIGCAACIGQKTTYYGADLIVTVGVDDLPQESDLRVKMPNYTDLFKGKWTSGKKSDEPYEISCLMGAMYFTTKAFYQKIGGFDTLPGQRFRGHKRWGSLEPYLSMKAWLSGGSVILYPDIEASHMFGRINRSNRWKKGARSATDMWWNKLFIAETMVFDERLRNKIINYPNPELNLNVAKRMIKRNYDNVIEVRDRNKTVFVRDMHWLMDYFKITLK